MLPRRPRSTGPDKDGRPGTGHLLGLEIRRWTWAVANDFGGADARSQMRAVRRSLETVFGLALVAIVVAALLREPGSGIAAHVRALSARLAGVALLVAFVDGLRRGGMARGNGGGGRLSGTWFLRMGVPVRALAARSVLRTCMIWLPISGIVALPAAGLFERLDGAARLGLVVPGLSLVLVGEALGCFARYRGYWVRGAIVSGVFLCGGFQLAAIVAETGASFPLDPLSALWWYSSGSSAPLVAAALWVAALAAAALTDWAAQSTSLGRAGWTPESANTSAISRRRSPGGQRPTVQGPAAALFRRDMGTLLAGLAGDPLVVAYALVPGLLAQVALAHSSPRAAQQLFSPAGMPWIVMAELALPSLAIVATAWQGESRMGWAYLRLMVRRPSLLPTIRVAVVGTVISMWVLVLSVAVGFATRFDRVVLDHVAIGLLSAWATASLAALGATYALRHAVESSLIGKVLRYGAAGVALCWLPASQMVGIRGIHAAIGDCVIAVVAYHFACVAFRQSEFIPELFDVERGIP